MSKYSTQHITEILGISVSCSTLHSGPVMDPTCVSSSIGMDDENLYARGVVFFSARKEK